MCDFSLHYVKSRPAKVGDKLITRDFGTGTRGFAASEDANLAVASEVACLPRRLLGWRQTVINHKTAIFRQINQDREMVHHDALEFADGQIVLLTFLSEGQQATVLQLPAASVESKAPAPQREAMEALRAGIAV
jgi:hypothetical protein